MMMPKPIERLRSIRMDEKERAAKSNKHRYTQAGEVAGKYITRMKTAKGSERAIVAQELLKFLSNDIKDETDEYIEQFYSAFDNVKTKESRLADLINNSNDPEDKKAGIFLIVCLAEHLPNMKRFLNFLLSSIEFFVDEEALVLATRASSYLVQLAKGYSSEFLNKMLDRCFDMLQNYKNDRFAGAVGCRELAIMTSTPFFLRANLFFRDIFDATRDQKASTRMAAVEALQAALSITSLREAKQKSEWFMTCYTKAIETTSELSGLSGEDLYHSILLMLNELVRIADGKFERIRRVAFGVQQHDITLSDPVGWLTLQRVTSVVESTTARALVKEKFNEIMEQISRATCGFKTLPRQPYLMAVIMELLPRLTAFEECTDDMKMNAFSIAKAGINKHPKYSLPCIGFLIALDSETYGSLRAGQDTIAVWRSKILQPCVDNIQTYLKDNASRKKYELDDSVFVFIYLFVCAYNEAVTEDVKNILPQLFKCPLSKALIRLLHVIVERIPPLSLSVYDGLVSVLYFVLTGQKMPNKTEMSSFTVSPHAAFEVPLEKVPRVVFALETLSEFNFHRHTLHLLIQYVSHGYLTCDSVKVRLAAVKCVCAMLTPFLKSFESAKSGSAKDRETRDYIRALVGESLQCLVSVAVTDPVAEVRLCVINCFSNTGRFFLYHLAVPHMLELQFMSLHDEKLEIQEAAVLLIGKLAEVNPAMILPRLRKTLVEAVSQMAYSGQARLEQHSARVLMHIAHQNPKFLRPYMLMLLDALIPKLKTEQVNVDVTVHVLKALSELCIVGGSEIVRSIDRLFQRLTVFIADPSSIQRRQASLELIGRICQATAYVVDPYKDYPTLLDDLLRLLKSEMSSEMRKAAMRTIGILGAIDPYTHKVYTGAVPSADKITTALSLPAVKVVSDSRQDVADVVQWFNYEKCTLEEFYPAITIANLMMMVQDEAYSQAYPVISNALITIFYSLNESYPQYVEQVVPRLLEVTKASKGKPAQRALFLTQLATLVSVIKSHAKPYLPGLFAIIADAWNEELIVKRTVISVIEQMGKALGAHFVPYIAELIPYLLRVVQTDKTNERELTVQVFLCTRSLAGNLGPHLHLILPPILSVLDDVNIDNNVRREALSTVMALSRQEDLSQYAPRLMQSWHKCISIKKDDPKNELQDLLYQLLIEIVKQMWLNYYVFRKGVDEKLKNCGLMEGDWKQQYFNYKKLADEAEQSQERKPPCLVTTTAPSQQKATDSNRNEVTMKRTIPTSSMYNYTPPLPPNIAKQKRTNTLIKSHAQSVRNLVTKDEWLQWLTTLRSLLVKSSYSAAIRAAHPICDYNPNMAKELFNASYMSIWTEMTSDEQREMAEAMLRALQCHIPEVVQTVLNLAEFMDHSEKGPLPILYPDLAAAAEEMRAYAKALRYTELQILQKSETELSVDDLQALITYANKLNVQENAAGVVRYAEMHNMQIPMQGRWYEKLNQWEKALESYESEQSQDQDTTLHQLRCLEALGRWTELNEKAASTPTIDPKMAVIAARGAWAVGNWKEMRKYVEHVTEHSHDGSLLRAVLAIKEGKDHYEEAETYINKVRDMFDSELSAMASESYERAYGAMVVVQQLSELEEAIEYKIRAERRPRIALLWSRRLQGCRENVEQWQRLIMLRSLVLQPYELHNLRVKFSSLCRRQGKFSMSRDILRSLLNLQPNEPLSRASVPNDKPMLVLAFCKQLWIDDMKMAAISTLDCFVQHFSRIPTNQLTLENRRLCAKALIKLGEWNEQLLANEQISQQLSTGNAQSGQTSAGSRGMSPAQGGQQQRARYSPDSTGMSIVIRHFSKATEYDKDWHKAWHKLAAAYCAAIQREREMGTSLRSLSQSALASPAMQRNIQSQSQMHAAQLAMLGHPALVGQIATDPQQLALMQAQAAAAAAAGTAQTMQMMQQQQAALQAQQAKVCIANQPPPTHMQHAYITQAIPPLAMPAQLLQQGQNVMPMQMVGMAPNHQAALAAAQMPPVSAANPLQFVAPPQLSPLALPPQSHSPQPPPLINTFAIQALRCFARVINLTPGSKLEPTLRLMQLWFDYGEHEDVYTFLRDVIKLLPSMTWLEVIPQLMARLDTTNKNLILTKQVIHELSKKNPQALIYALTVASRSHNADRANNAHEMLTLMGEMHTELVNQARIVTQELVRCAILWHEQWHDALDEASRLYFQDNNIKGMLDCLLPLHAMIERGASTLKEQSFNQTYCCDLMDAVKFCHAYKNTQNKKELNQAWEIYCTVFKRIAAQLRQITSLDLSYISPLLMRSKDLILCVPGTYDPSQPLVSIASINSHLQIISSKQRPRKVIMRGSNGLEYYFLLKGHEDPRQDERVMQLFGLINTILQNNSETCRRNLTIQRYSVVALSKDSGLIGWVPNCDTLHSLVKDYREKKKMSLSIEHKKMQELASDTEMLTLFQKVQLFERAVASTPGDDLRNILWLKSPNSEVWFDRRTNYTRSMGCMSMVGYILGLGDRHPSNLMLDRLTGKIVHIDFGDCFDVAMSREKFPERIPFRLTRMLIKAMEVTGIEGTYRATSEQVMALMRANKESLLAVLEAFVYDPVINWRLMDANKKGPTEKKDYGKMNMLEAPRQVSQQVIDRIRQKLTGREFEPGVEVDVREQLNRLVEQATLPLNLCQCYIGWCPFW